MTLNCTVALILRYFTEFDSFWGALGKSAVEGIVLKKFTFAISSPDEFLVCVYLLALRFIG